MDFIKGIPRNQYFREYYQKRKPKTYCHYCKIHYSLKYKHLKSNQHKLNLAQELNVSIHLL